MILPQIKHALVANPFSVGGFAVQLRAGLSPDSLNKLLLNAQ